MIIPQEEMSSARVQALAVSVGFFTFISIGIAACIGLVVTIFYLLASFVLLLLQAIAETFSSMATVWINGDPLFKVVLLALVGYGVYRLYQLKKRGH